MQSSRATPLDMEMPPSRATTAASENLSEGMQQLIRSYVAQILSNRDVALDEGSTFAVSKIYDAGKEVGTFTFISESVGVTNFHVVYLSKSKEIREATLEVLIEGDFVRVKHVVSHPFFDLSVYRLQNHKAAKYFDLKLESVKVGDGVTLMSFPDVDTGDCNLNAPVFFHGTVEQSELSLENIFCLANYECFPGCSGGAVLSSRSGKLLGIHCGLCYHEDGTYHSPFRKDVQYPFSAGAVRTLHWSPALGDVDLELPSEGSSEESSQSSEEASPIVDCKVAINALASSLKSVRETAMYAAANVSHKGHLACFLPAPTIHALVVGEFDTDGSLGKRKYRRQNKKRKYRRQNNVAVSDNDKAWSKRMKVIRRFLEGVHL